MSDLQGWLADYVAAEMLRRQIVPALGNGDAHVQAAEKAGVLGKKMEEALREVVRSEIQRFMETRTGLPSDVYDALNY